MERLLQERVEAEGNGQQMVLERCDRLNRLIGDAVYNIQRKGARNVGLSDVDKLNTANSTASSLQGAYAVHLVRMLVQVVSMGQIRLFQQQAICKTQKRYNLFKTK